MGLPGRRTIPWGILGGTSAGGPRVARPIRTPGGLFSDTCEHGGDVAHAVLATGVWPLVTQASPGRQRTRRNPEEPPYRPFAIARVEPLLALVAGLQLLKPIQEPGGPQTPKGPQTLLQASLKRRTVAAGMQPRGDAGNPPGCAPGPQHLTPAHVGARDKRTEQGLKSDHRITQHLGLGGQGCSPAS